METQHTRTDMLLGEGAAEALSKKKVAVFGVGGVGGYAVEALARAGVGELVLVDSDRVSLSNINRQIIATHQTVGRLKTEAARDRIAEINPEARVELHSVFFGEENKSDFDFSSYDYVIDAIDSLSSKLALIEAAKTAGAPIISAMGAGNKLDPTAFEVADISKTQVCPLARAVRIGLRKRGINHLKVVYSKEPPVIPPEVSDGVKKRVPGSVSFVPSVMGLILAGEVIKDISKI
jgi:tRNA A37 threonylcarbamoyladenosine dehydratase